MTSPGASGWRVWTAYGLSEGDSVCMCRVPEQLKDIRLMGRTRDDFDVRLAGEDGYEAPVGKVGEVLQRPKEPYSTMLGYYGLPDKTVEAWKDLWLHTWPTGTGRGFTTLPAGLRRPSVEGAKTFPRRPELVLPAVMETAVVPVPSDLGMAGENEIMAVIVLKEGQQLKEEDLISFLEPRLPYFMVPRYIKFAVDLPRTPTNKVRRTALQEG